MLAAGVGVFLGFYGLGIFTTAALMSSKVKAPGVGFVPIAGPIYLASDRQLVSSDSGMYVVLGLLAIESIGQLVGTALIIAGSVPREAEVRHRSTLRSTGPFFRLDARGPALVF